MRRRRAVQWAVAFGAFLIAATFADRWALHAFYRPELQDTEWWWLLRHAGDLRVWAALGLGLGLAGVAWPRAAYPLASAAVAGGVAELGKLLIGRERPVRDGIIQNDGFYVWKGLLRGFVDSGNLGIPSSHTAVAFGGAMALSLFGGRVLWVAVPIAMGCGMTRMVTGAHFLSDVVAGAACGVLAAGLLRPLAGQSVHSPTLHGSRRAR
jgi:undecaprenyl-diphosphatase